MGEIISMKDHKKKKRKLKKPFKKNKKSQSQALVVRGQMGAEQQIPQRKRRKAGSLKWLFVVLVMLICLTAGYSFAQSAFFAVDEIVVSGNSKVPAEKLIQLSGITKGELIFKANTTRAENMIITNNWIEKVNVKRQLPNTVKIVVAERLPIAAIATTKGLATIDKTGFMLEQKKLLDGLPLMIITGVDDIKVQLLPGRKVESAKVEAGLAVVLQMSQEASSVISELNVKNPQNISARTTYGIKIIIGDKNSFLEKYNIAKQIMQAEDEKGNLSKIEYIDVSIKTQPTLRYLKTDEGEKAN